MLPVVDGALGGDVREERNQRGGGERKVERRGHYIWEGLERGHSGGERAGESGVVTFWKQCELPRRHRHDPQHQLFERFVPDEAGAVGRLSYKRRQVSAKKTAQSLVVKSRRSLVPR